MVNKERTRSVLTFPVETLALLTKNGDAATSSTVISLLKCMPGAIRSLPI
jgi:hypothetical protein